MWGKIKQMKVEISSVTIYSDYVHQFSDAHKIKAGLLEEKNVHSVAIWISPLLPGSGKIHMAFWNISQQPQEEGRSGGTIMFLLNGEIGPKRRGDVVRLYQGKDLIQNT